jgi:predicted transcriptional regulator
MPVRIRGVDYLSAREAAKAIGVSPSAISKALKETGTADNVGQGMLGAKPGNKNGCKPLTIAGLTFTSRTEAAKELGVTRSQITKWISPDASSAQRQMLLAAAMQYHQKKGPQKGSL